jgi:hypothetical protein
MDRRTTLAALAGIAAAPLAARAAEPTKIVFGYTAVTDFANLFVGIEEGFFRKRGLDVEAKFIPLNSTIPAAVQAAAPASRRRRSRRPASSPRPAAASARRPTSPAGASACPAWAPSCT